MKKIHKISFLILAILVTIATAYFQYIPRSQGEIDGVCPNNIKGICTPVAGFPVPYAKDSESHSVVGALEFIGDDLYPHWFLVDVMIFYSVFFLGFKYIFARSKTN